jgi:pimeloyl-ACP methyl ester carboxylesterase
MPVLAIGGALAAREIVAQTMRTVAADVRSVVLPDTGHYVTDENPEAFIRAILPFLGREKAAPLNGSAA